MTRKQIILDAIHQKPTSRQPVIILAGGIWENSQIGLSFQNTFDLPPHEVAQYMIDANNNVQSDILWSAAGCNNLVLRAIGASTTFSKVGMPATVDKPLIEDAEDVDKLDLSAIENDPGIHAMLENTRILKERVGDEVLIGISQWGPMTLAGLLMGIEDFMVLSLTEEDAAEYVLKFAEKLTTKYWKLFLDAGAEIVCLAEPSTSGDLISPAQFETMALPHMQAVYRAIDGYPNLKAKMLHICGNINRILPLIPETGADMISFDYKVDLKRAREILGGKMAFAGNLDPVGVMQNETPERIIELTKQCMADAETNKGGYVVMPGCDLTPGTPLENIHAMIETARNTQLL